MNRRDFLGSAGAALLLARPLEAWAAPPYRASRLLRGALVFDGTGAAPRELDVALEGDRIAGVGRRLSVPGADIVDLKGLALAPGFIDIHSHTDLVLLLAPRADSKVRQGVTTEVAGQDGGSVGPWSEERARATAERYDVEVPFRDLAGFFAEIERRGASVNLTSMVGAGTIRGYVVGDDDRPATPDELARMVAEVERALAAGARGLSSGLEYTPGAFASLAELVALAGALRGTGLPYASHMRNEDDRLFAAVEEAISVGHFAGVPVQISHLKAQYERNWWKARPVLEMIEAARDDGIDVMFDRYPYVAYSTTLANLFPVSARDGGTDAFLARLRDPAQLPALEAYARDKVAALGSWDSVQITSTGSDELAWARGRRLGELARERGREPFALLLEIMLADRSRTGMVGFGMSEENTALILAHPLGMVCSDGGAQATTQGSPHPRAYGTFPRVLGHYCREKKVMPLETAIHKMTGMPAARLKLAGRGRIEPGAAADLVAFDPDRVADRATFDAPHQYPEGIPYVWVNGEAVVREGEHSGRLSGRVLRGRVM